MLTKEKCLDALSALEMEIMHASSLSYKYKERVLNVSNVLFQLINEHFENATPKKAILVHEYDGYMYECPNCHEEFRPNYILDNITWKGCPFCLQALDWSEEDEVE